MPTRAQIEAEIAGRARVALITSQVSADPIGDASPRAYLNDPIRSGLVAIEKPPADSFAVVDADLDGIDGVDLDNLIDTVELAALELALNNIDAIDTRTTDVDQRRSQYADRLEKVIARKRASLVGRIGLDVEAPESGTIKLGFQAGSGTVTEFD